MELYSLLHSVALNIHVRSSIYSFFVHIKETVQGSWGFSWVSGMCQSLGGSCLIVHTGGNFLCSSTRFLSLICRASCKQITLFFVIVSEIWDNSIHCLFHRRSDMWQQSENTLHVCSFAQSAQLDVLHGIKWYFWAWRWSRVPESTLAFAVLCFSHSLQLL